MSQALNAFMVLALTVLSGLLDARGFAFASKAWPGGSLDPRMAGLSVLCFAVGLSSYVLAVKFIQALGVHGVVLQSALWFIVTAVGISILDSTILQWSRTQQIVGLLVGVGLGWLIVSTAVTESAKSGGP